MNYQLKMAFIVILNLCTNICLAQNEIKLDFNSRSRIFSIIDNGEKHEIIGNSFTRGNFVKPFTYPGRRN